VLTASSISGAFSNSTIAINGSEHFNVSYTSTGVVLTVASGDAPQSGGSAKSGLVAALPRRGPVMTSALSHRIGANRGSILLAGMRNIRARSGVILPGGGGLGRYEGSNRLGEFWRMPRPVVTTWQQKPSATPASGLQPSLERVTASKPWTAPVGGVSSLRMTATGTLTQRRPVRILPPMMPRLQR
jgi:hypothetical protein